VRRVSQRQGMETAREGGEGKDTYLHDLLGTLLLVLPHVLGELSGLLAERVRAREGGHAVQRFDAKGSFFPCVVRFSIECNIAAGEVGAEGYGQVGMI
jgi:hypothetical protein